ncbi:hypothetical protein ABIE65_004794 [Constrictibacter sp. MBR-5]|uniref:hypothetical protein n=1 Tax=Constrictibacter sp. MBR-5 TaxID=3156467 RepID=UPI003392227C
MPDIGDGTGEERPGGTGGTSPTTWRTGYAGLELAAAIDAAVMRWMGWRIGRQTERDTGIPRGWGPHLTGFVGHHEAALAD